MTTITSNAPRWRKVGDQWAVIGTVADIAVDKPVTVTRRDGSTETVTPLSVGTTFEINGTPHRIGYLHPAPDPDTVNATPAQIRYARDLLAAAPDHLVASSGHTRDADLTSFTHPQIAALINHLKNPAPAPLTAPADTVARTAGGGQTTVVTAVVTLDQLIAHYNRSFGAVAANHVGGSYSSFTVAPADPRQGDIEVNITINH